MRSFNPPVKDGEEFKLTIEAEGNKGDGITKIDGYVIFVSEGKIGRKYNVRIKKALDKYAFADIIEEI